MAFKYREEIVGKRFLALKATGPPESSTESSSDPSAKKWLSGFIRASTERDVKNPELQVLVEFDGVDWQQRDWLKVVDYFSVLLVENTLVLAQRTHPERPTRKCLWPALDFKAIVDKVGLDNSKKPIEFLVDRHLEFVTEESVLEYKESSRLDQECKVAAKKWFDYQDGQGILVSTPSVLVGYRVKVYRTEGTTQWFTAVLKHYDETNKEYRLVDDTVLEELYGSAELIQMVPLGGAVEHILKGSETRVTPRRSCKEAAIKEKNKESSNSGQTTQSSSTTGQSKHPKAQTPTEKHTKSSVVPASHNKPQSSAAKQQSKKLEYSRKDKSGGNTVTKQQTAIVSCKPEAQTSTDKNNSVSETEEASTAATVHTSVIRHAPTKGEKRQRSKSTSQSLSVEHQPKATKVEVEATSGKSQKKKVKRADSTDNKLNGVTTTVTTSPTASSNQNTSSSSSHLSPSLHVAENVKEQQKEHTENNQQTVSQAEMHIKKQRILGTNGDKAPTASNSSAVSASSSNTSAVVTGNHTLPAPNTTHVTTAQIEKTKTVQQRPDRLSENSVDGCSSGYCSAATSDSTISPRDKDGHKIPLPSTAMNNSIHRHMTTSSPSSASNIPIGLTSTPTSVVSPNPAARLPPAQSPLAANNKPKSQQDLPRGGPSSASPHISDGMKEPAIPVLPYRDQELMKRDEQARKSQHTPTTAPPSSVPSHLAATSRAAALLGSAGLPPGLTQQQALLNPQFLQMQQQMMQQVQQMQLLEQYRQLQALGSMNPLQQFPFLQQQQQQQLQQQLLLESLYRRPGLPPTTSAPAHPWGMMPGFGDKQLMTDLILREQEYREALAQKERAEREKQEKEKAEKKRLEEEKEKRQQAAKKERARILQESAQQAQDAVNEHFNESLKRAMPHSSSMPISPEMIAMMRKNFEPQQAQDLSLHAKPKDFRAMDPALQAREREMQVAQMLTSFPTADKQKAMKFNSSHEHFMRSIQTGCSGQDTSSEARLVEEHFKKAMFNQLPLKTEQAEFSLYGYQSQPNKFVSKDQLQQQLIKSESKVNDSRSSPKTSTSNKSRSAASHTSSSQLIQEGLIPNPAYSDVSSMDTSSSITALVNMSKDAGNRMSQRYNEKPHQVKTEPRSLSSTSHILPNTESSQDTQNSQMYVKSFKSYVENAVTQAFFKDIEEQKKKSSAEAAHSTAPTNAEPATKTDKSNGANDTDSDTLSAPSPTSSIKTESQDSKPCHPKMRLKKEWSQRHTNDGQGQMSSSPGPVASNLLNHSNASNNSETTSASENEADHAGSHKQRSKKRKSEDPAVLNGSAKKSKNSEVSSGHINNSTSCLSDQHHRQSVGGSSSNSNSSCGDVWSAVGGGEMQQKQTSYNDEQDSIKQLAEIALRADRMEAVPYASKPLVRVSISTLKKTNQPFVQDGSCIEMAPKLTRCRECKMTPNQRNKKIPNIFCRFYAFRMLKFNRSGQICIAGFCDPSDAEPDDIALWLPHRSAKKRSVTPADVRTAKYIVANVGDEFCRLVEQEQECAIWSGNKRLWKRAVQGVREMCDVCDTTLFNTHWVCHRCGFVVCIDCYRVKRKIQAKYSNNVEEENRKWLSCTSNKNHEAERMMLTAIVPGDALKIAGDLIHHVRRKHGIASNCPCGRSNSPQRTEANTNSPSNGLSQHLLNAVAVSKESLHNGVPEAADSRLSSSYPTDGYRQSTFLSTSLDNKALNSYSDDPLSLLADVASMAPTSTNGSGLLSEVKLNNVSGEEMEMDVEKKPCLTLRKLLTKNHQVNGLTADRKEVGESNGTHSPTRPAEDHKAMNGRHFDYVYYKRRSGSYLYGRSTPIPSCTLSETSVLFPTTSHRWLCDGKVLRLMDPKNHNNSPLFTQRWTLGTPIIVSNVSKCMRIKDLWTPEAFSMEFGHIRHDLIDCRRNEPLTGYQIKHFWDGFQDVTRRLEDSDGNPLILKLKDWPTSEDFAESMPSRFIDLMDALPMPEYTRRNGDLNLASRLPEFFVKPDLGPKMYIAYGLAKYPQSGTTNLHLDVSDAVNVMVFVSHDKELEDDVKKLIDASDCDEAMKRRVTIDGETPGALWHIYDACDADKIRDLLNKVALEQGMELEPYHDPIHDQQFYLDRSLRKRLSDEYGVHGYAILQCEGDAVFIPAGAPHQVQNLNGCIKVAEDFVSPEHLHHCFNLTQEFRHLSNTHTNHEDKLQVKNIIYHAVKDAVAILDQSEPISS